MYIEFNNISNSLLTFMHDVNIIINIIKLILFQVKMLKIEKVISIFEISYQVRFRKLLICKKNFLSIF